MKKEDLSCKLNHHKTIQREVFLKNHFIRIGRSTSKQVGCDKGVPFTYGICHGSLAGNRTDKLLRLLEI